MPLCVASGPSPQSNFEGDLRIALRMVQDRNPAEKKEGLRLFNISLRDIDHPDHIEVGLEIIGELLDNNPRRDQLDMGIKNQIITLVIDGLKFYQRQRPTIPTAEIPHQKALLAWKRSGFIL